MADVPHEFRCPISMELMKDPVVCEDGHSYDRESIIGWLERSATSPMTRQPISRTNLRANHALKASIQRWQGEKNKPKPPMPSAPSAPSEPRVVIPFTPSYQPPPYPSYQAQQPQHSQYALVTHSIVPYSTPKIREPPQQQVIQTEQQKRKIKIILTLCSSITFLIILISILSIKTRSRSENDDD